MLHVAVPATISVTAFDASLPTEIRASKTSANFVSPGLGYDYELATLPDDLRVLSSLPFFWSQLNQTAVLTPGTNKT